MSIQALDVELQVFLTDGWDYVRANINASIDEVFGSMKQAHLQKLYGQKEIDSIKTWVRQNNVPVVQSWSLQPERVPQISIHLAQSSELTEKSSMADWAETFEADVAPTVIVPAFVPTTYTYSGSVGTITVDKSTDLSDVRPGFILVDGKNEPYTIISPITDTTFAIDVSLGHNVNLRKLVIQTAEGKTKMKGGQQMFNDTINIGIHGLVDTNTVLWMYYITAWLLFKFKPVLEKRGIQLQTFSGSEFTKEPKYMGEHIYSRWMTFSAITTIEWTETLVDSSVESFETYLLQADSVNSTAETTTLGTVKV